MYSFFTLSIAWGFSPAYQTLLEKYADNTGCIDYPSWKIDPLYKDFVSDLRTHTPKDDSAYWINIYNAYTIHIVLEHYPIESIRSIQKGSVWSTYPVVLPHKTITLDHIEHKILRPRGDARIHAALSCASRGCPPLWNKPFSTKTLDEELDQAMHRWLDQNGLHQDRGRLHLSEIFLWSCTATTICQSSSSC